MEMLFIFLYLLIVFFVIEISVMVFHVTGLEKSVSRYQVISMLTGTGFTTDESRLIIDHPVRRRISAFLILFGAFSLAVIISAITTILSGDLRMKELIIINSILLFLLVVSKLPAVQKKIQDKFDYEMHKNLDIAELPVKDALYLEEDDVLTKVAVDEDAELIGKEVQSLFESEQDITLLFIKRGEIFIRNLLHKENIQAGDVLFLYGSKEAIEKDFLEKNGKKEDQYVGQE